MARKVFISFLGFTNYKECRYYAGDFTSDNVRYIQEATLDYLRSVEEWGKNDVAYILLTDGAKKANWLDNGHKDRETKEVIRQAGLRTCLSKKNYLFDPIEGIPDGNNEEELFTIFSRVFEVLNDGDELYFDVTHSFRSLPMLVLVLVNYAKFLRGITVKSITYGNYEARKKEDGNEYAPIINLLPLSQIQDWTFATADFLKNGTADRFAELAETYRRSVFKGMRVEEAEKALAVDRLAKSLKAVVDDFLMCRGKEILKPAHLQGLDFCLQTVKDTIPQYIEPVIDELTKAFSGFTKDCSSDQLNNGFEAARWCIEHNLYQQAATILQENVVTFFCLRYSLDNIYDETQRSLVNQAFKKVQLLNSSKTTEEDKEQIRAEINNNELLKKLTTDKLLTDSSVYEAFSMLTDERNDINHSGMRNNPKSSKRIRNNICKAYEVLRDHLSKFFCCL